jgi:hypothetical protein
MNGVPRAPSHDRTRNTASQARVSGSSVACLRPSERGITFTEQRTVPGQERLDTC